MERLYRNLADRHHESIEAVQAPGQTHPVVGSGLLPYWGNLALQGTSVKFWLPLQPCSFLSIPQEAPVSLRKVGNAVLVWFCNPGRDHLHTWRRSTKTRANPSYLLQSFHKWSASDLKKSPPLVLQMITSSGME